MRNWVVFLVYRKTCRHATVLLLGLVCRWWWHARPSVHPHRFLGLYCVRIQTLTQNQYYRVLNWYQWLLCFLLSSPYIFVTLLLWHVAQITMWYHYFMFTPCPDTGSSPEPLDCKSEALPTELCGPLSTLLFKDIYKLNEVSNNVILMIIGLSVN